MTTLSTLANGRSAPDVRHSPNDLAAAPAPVGPAGHEPRFRRVLLVEDEVALRKVVARILASRGVEVSEAGTAAEAIRATAAACPDLVLLDINLPDQTGWDVLRELKRRGTAVPTIIVSAVRVSQRRLDEFQPLAYLPTPFPIEALLRLVFRERSAGRAVPAEDE
jgi:DNA-binding response OmpR family regulator